MTDITVYLYPPTIPAGMTITSYRKSRPKKVRRVLVIVKRGGK